MLALCARSLYSRSPSHTPANLQLRADDGAVTRREIPIKNEQHLLLLRRREPRALALACDLNRSAPKKKENRQNKEVGMALAFLQHRPRPAALLRRHARRFTRAAHRVDIRPPPPSRHPLPPSADPRAAAAAAAQNPLEIGGTRGLVVGYARRLGRPREPLARLGLKFWV